MLKSAFLIFHFITIVFRDGVRRDVSFHLFCSLLLSHCREGKLAQSKHPINICWIWISNYIFRNTKPFSEEDIFIIFEEKGGSCICAYKNLWTLIKSFKENIWLKKIVITVCWYIMPHSGLKVASMHTLGRRGFFGILDKQFCIFGLLGLQRSVN